MIKLPQVQMLFAFVNRLSKREKMFLYGAVAAVLLALLRYLIVLPVSNEIAKLHNEIAMKQKCLEDDRQLLARKVRIVEESKAYTAFVPSGGTEEDNLNGLLKEVESLANKSALYIVDMKPSTTKEGIENSKKYVVTLTAEGEMAKIMDFIYRVENAGTLLAIEKYQISPKSKESSVAQTVIAVSKTVMALP
jgi:hypothetical protein